MAAVVRRGRPRVHPLGSTYYDRAAARAADAEIAGMARDVAILLGHLAGVLDDFVRAPGDGAAVVEAVGDALNALFDLAEKMSRTAGRVRGVADVRWMMKRLRWPQASACRRDAEELRGMAERLGRLG